MCQDIKEVKQWTETRMQHFLDKFKKENDEEMLETLLDVMIKIAGISKLKFHEMICKSENHQEEIL